MNAVMGIEKPKLVLNGIADCTICAEDSVQMESFRYFKVAGSASNDFATM